MDNLEALTFFQWERQPFKMLKLSRICTYVHLFITFCGENRISNFSFCVSMVLAPKIVQSDLSWLPRWLKIILMKCHEILFSGYYTMIVFIFSIKLFTCPIATVVILKFLRRRCTSSYLGFIILQKYKVI